MRLLKFTPADEPAPIWINADLVTIVTRSAEGTTRVHLAGGEVVVLDDQLDAVLSRLATNN